MRDFSPNRLLDRQFPSFPAQFLSLEKKTTNDKKKQLSLGITMWCLFTPVKLFSCFLSFLQLNCYECLTWSALAVLSARPSFPLLRIIFVRHMINLTSAKLPVMENISYKVKPASFSSCCKEQPSKKFFGAAWLIIFSFCRVLGIWDSQEFLFKSNACFTRALPVSFRFSQFFSCCYFDYL